MPAARRKNVLVLFPNEWDRAELSAARYTEQYELLFEGFDLFRFPSNLQLLWFDARRFIERIVQRYRHAGLAGVLSNEEQFGAAIAATVAQRLGLPSADPDAILRAQHKYYARRQLQRAFPDATPAFDVFPFGDLPDEPPLPYPFFAKPVKATFSILARRIESCRDLESLLDIPSFERRLFRKLIQPCNDLGGFPIDAAHMLAEEVLEGRLVTVEGLVHESEIQILGIVDAVMYPGTDAFKRFEYPSSLPAAVQSRMAELASGIVRALELEHGFFNVELVHDPITDRIKILEVNPRLAYQFADLRQKVDGYRAYDALLAMAVGEAPPVHALRQGAHAHAASFVWRSFEPRRLKEQPDARTLAELSRRYDDARLVLYPKSPSQMRREMRWLGSCRHAICNLGAADPQQLFERYRRVRRDLALQLA